MKATTMAPTATVPRGRQQESGPATSREAPGRRGAIKDRLLFCVLMLCAGCAGLERKLVWVEGSEKPGIGARVELSSGMLAGNIRGVIENVKQYASIPENWTGPVPWSKDDAPPTPPGDPD